MKESLNFEKSKIKSFTEEATQLGGMFENMGVEVVDKNPSSKKTDIPVCLNPGWAITSPIVNDTTDRIASEGRRILTINHSRIENKKLIETIESDKDFAKYSPVEMQKALAILEVLNEKHIDKTDAIGYSEGGLNLAIAATLSPEKFRNIIFWQPAGLIGEDSFAKLSWRYLMDQAQKISVKSEERSASHKDALEHLKYIFGNISLSAKEAKAISQADIMDMVESLNNQGIEVTIVGGTDDKIFPMDKMQERLKKQMIENQNKEDEDKNNDRRFYSVNFIEGTHNDLYRNPIKSADLIDKTLDSMEKRSEELEEKNELKMEHCWAMEVLEKEHGNLPNDSWSNYSGGMLIRATSLEESIRNALIQIVANERSFYRK